MPWILQFFHEPASIFLFSLKQSCRVAAVSLWVKLKIKKVKTSGCENRMNHAHYLPHSFCKKENISFTTVRIFTRAKYVYLKRRTNFLSNHRTHKK